MSIPFQYIRNLRPAEAEKQKELIQESRKQYKATGEVKDRPKVSDALTPRSSHVIKFERKYGFSVADTARVKTMFPDTDVRKILSKGAGAYASSGSRPNVSVAQWSNARLASVLTGGPALKVDKDLVGKYSMARIKS
jgi:hypothetical protein